jgi:hypothetical protein
MRIQRNISLIEVSLWNNLFSITLGILIFEAPTMFFLNFVDTPMGIIYDVNEIPYQ